MLSAHQNAVLSVQLKNNAICLPRAAGSHQVACLRLLQTYAELAQRKQHLLGNLLGEELPLQWTHYPENDAIDYVSGFQWFYHSHSAEDRSDSSEHGHIHLFARRKLWSRRLRSGTELQFTELTGSTDQQVNTRHLLCISFNSTGIPIALFTVNSWVTGDLMLSAKTTIHLLDKLKLDTGNSHIDTVIMSVVTLCKEEIRRLLETRDQQLLKAPKLGLLDNKSLECLSTIPIDLDDKLTQLNAPHPNCAPPLSPPTTVPSAKPPPP